MITGDIGAELAAVLRAAVAAGELPAAAGPAGAAGTWRPAPPGEGGGPGTYATSLPIPVARRAGQDAGAVATRLAAALDRLPWIASARGSGAGYLTVTVTIRHLAGLPARIVAAGQPAEPASQDLPDPAAAPDWPRAWNAQRETLAGRLAVAAGQAASGLDSERLDDGGRRPGADSRPGPGAPSGGAGAGAAVSTTAARAPGGPVAAAVAWHGADAVRYALARTAGPWPAAIERQLGLPLDLDNPFVLVRYAHAHAASTANWAADLARATGSSAGSGGPELGDLAGPGEPGPGDAAAYVRPGRPPGAGGRERAGDHQPAELALIDLLSWQPERLGAAARRRRPAELCAYLEQLAGAYLSCARDCPALPYGGAAAPPDSSGALAAARLELAAAARVVLVTGLSLAGVGSVSELFRI